MREFRDEMLHRIRTPQQALADLAVKYKKLHRSHPERSILARMIDQLEGEIALRGG